MPEDIGSAAGAPSADPRAEADAAGRQTGATSGAAGGSGAPQPTPIIDAVQDLTQTAVDYVRTQIEDIMRDKVALPLQKVGFTLFAAFAAALLFVLGINFIAVGLLILLAQFVGWVLALVIVGAVLCIGAGVFTYLKIRSMQHERPADAGQGKPVAPADAPGTPPSIPRRTEEEGGGRP